MRPYEISPIKTIEQFHVKQMPLAKGVANLGKNMRRNRQTRGHDTAS